MAIIEGLAIISTAGCIFLTVLGCLCLIEYEFLPLRKVVLRDAGINCLIAAGIYFIILVFIVCWKKRPKKSLIKIPETDNLSDEDNPFLKHTKKIT